MQSKSVWPGIVIPFVKTPHRIWDACFGAVINNAIEIEMNFIGLIGLCLNCDGVEGFRDKNSVSVGKVSEYYIIQCINEHQFGNAGIRW